MGKLETERWKPRFSLAFLIVAVLGAAAYFGLLQATKDWGTQDVKDFLARQDRLVEIEDVTAKAPLVIEAGELLHEGGISTPLSSLTWKPKYYLWIFGYVIELDL
ncbi:hypothetical protein ETAA8_24480 [Anatilimnocola aggregata]|uniref:Uncharacterized protein n=1 Tax=Anatilimnocola aggregata TaxID=2528021 RepID=A0A517YAY1_9BACT|nr:hypothetical protein [Anatilimnocola aggregata]QDU27361.1 hypothetical protein ETAA8_24480 [Anatilimnocola aggregata]